MNLYTSAWIPVRESGQLRHITLESLLCEDKTWELSLYRDDMESSAMQLLISLMQVAFTPNDNDELRERIKLPLSKNDFAKGVEHLADWFDLDHPEYPFMQVRGAKTHTPIQKIMLGLPEGTTAHAFFNPKGEVSSLCPSCCAIALFNYATNGPSFGGGFKYGLRTPVGTNAPVTTLVIGRTLRETLWCNILTKEMVNELIPYSDANSKPTWVSLIKQGGIEHTYKIGLLRGLFWQPSKIELEVEDEDGMCDSCGQQSKRTYSGFKKDRFTYSVDGIWPHPHSPQVWDLKRGVENKRRFASFNSMAPAWTHLNQFLITQNDSIPAPVVQQFKKLFPNQPLNLYVSGYRNKQAAILMRRHDLFSMPVDWSDGDRLTNAIEMAKEVRKLLRSKLYGFAKQVGANVHEDAQQQFDRRSEPLIHELLTEMTFKEKKVAFEQFRKSIIRLARELFEQVTTPYRHSIPGMENYVKFKGSFNTEAAKLR